MSSGSAPPGLANGWHAAHVDLLLDSLERLTGRRLHHGPERGARRAQAVFSADYALLSHGLEADPLFNYANQQALTLFELDWSTLLTTPSRASAEPANQHSREKFMAEVRAQGYAERYRGVRVSTTGRRFTIEDATVWNVVDGAGVVHGQAATFARWQAL